MKIHKNHISNITIFLDEILSTNENIQDRDVINQLFSQYFSHQSSDQTCSLVFWLENKSPVMTIYQWDFQDVKTRLMGQGFIEYKALEKIHQRKENNLKLIVRFFVDLFYLKNNKYKPYLFKDQQYNKQEQDDNDNYLELQFHHELFVFCIQYLTDTQIKQQKETSHQKYLYDRMKNDNVKGTKLRRQFAEKFEKFSQTLEAIEKDANENNASGSLGLTKYIHQLNLKKDNLYNGKFKFLTLGDFNLGKSTILNVLLCKDVLPTDVTPCTAIPTIIKYGSQEKVLVHSKNSDPLELSIEEFKQEFTSSSKTLKDRSKKEPKEFKQYRRQRFEQYTYAELEYPLALLEQNIEFIDSAGLNNSPEDNAKTLYYIDKVDAVFFVLDSRKQLTEQEQQYLKQYIQGNVKAVFYLINFWDQVEKGKEEQVRQEFIERLSETLAIAENEVEEMWGKRIFEISAKNDLAIINNSQSLQGTTCENFWDQLELFLLSGRLSTELSDASRIANNIYQAIAEIVELRLVTLNDSLEEINNKVENCEPHFDTMKDIIKKLREKVDSEKQKCVEETAQSYQQHFDNICKNFNTNFLLPELNSFDKEDILDFIIIVEQEYQQYIENKYRDWEKDTQTKLDSRFELLEQNFEISITKYQQAKNQIKDILQGNEKTIKLPDSQETFINELPNLPNITVIPIPGIKKRYLIVGLLVSAVVLGGGLIGQTIGKLVAEKLKQEEIKQNIEEIKQKIKDELQNSLSNMNNKEQLETIRNKIQSLFDGYSSTVDDLNNDVVALENSLNNLIEQKKTREIDCESAKNNLNDFVNNISSQRDKIEADFREYLQVKN